MYIMSKNGYTGLINFIHDLIHCDLSSKTHDAYQFLLHLLEDLGLPISHSKFVPLATSGGV